MAQITKKLVQTKVYTKTKLKMLLRVRISSLNTVVNERHLFDFFFFNSKSTLLHGIKSVNSD